MKLVTRWSVASLLLASAFAGTRVEAQVTVGTAQLNGGNCYPIGCDEDLVRYQQLYAASVFSGPINITGITLFHTADLTSAPGFLAQGTYNFSFGYSTKTVGSGLSTTLNDNVTSPLSFFGTLIIGAGVSGVPSTFTYMGTSAFAYNPALGNLLMDVSVNNLASGNPTYNDSDLSGTYMVRAYQYENGSSGSSATGLVTRFETGPNAVVTPEPASFAMVGAGMLGLGLIARRRKGRTN